MAIMTGATIAVGSSSADASATALVMDAAHPYVAWTTPGNFAQRRFAVRIENVEPGGWAYTTSGTRLSDQKWFQFPPGIGLNENFAGRCKITVALSAVTSGPFEWTIEREVVYDRFVQRLLKATEVSITWSAGRNPDMLPANGVRRFHVQVATDLAFANLVFENAQIYDASSPVVKYKLDRWKPEPNATYLYRVREHDGLDWSEWSPTNAFVNLGNVPGAVTIVSVQPMDNEHGDYVITFDVEDPDNQTNFVEFTYTTKENPDRLPASLTGPTLVTPSGRQTAVWRTYRNFGSSLVEDVVLYARTIAAGIAGPEHSRGPLTIDSRRIDEPGGGIGSTEWSVGVAGRISTMPSPSDTTEVIPVHARSGTIERVGGKMREQSPVGGGAIVQHQAAFLARLETEPFDTISAGWENPERYKWPVPLSACWGEGDTFDEFKTVPFPSGKGPLNPHATAKAFLFQSPLPDPAQPDTWQRPYSASAINDKSYLAGWTDFTGTVRLYPDGYDWSRRPASHVGREVWVTGDAWVQIAELAFTDYPACETCKGRNWVPSETAPYTREPCPNAACVDGFDHSAEPFLSPDLQRPVLRAYIKPRWYRLSTITDGRLLTAEGRMGVPIPTLQQITKDSEQSQVPVEGRQVVAVPGEGFDVAEVVPTQVEFDHSTTMEPEQLPAQGTHGPKRERFTWGVAEPLQNVGQPLLSEGEVLRGPQYPDRTAPTQDWNIRTHGGVLSAYQVRPLEFRFLNSYWDAYNTIHFRQTGSETSMVHLQVARVTDGRLGEWTDVAGDNATWVPEANAHLIPPLTFHMYWATRNRELFPFDTAYRLRMRQFDPKTKAFTGWYYSDQFQLLEGVANPVSMLSLEYEPWSRNVEIKFRIDDSEGDHYNLTRFWYSPDDGDTWREVARGDIAGSTYNLSPADNPHTIWWKTIGLNLGPGDQYRFRIEAVPTHLAEKVTVPDFKWFSQPNPVTDPAEATVIAAMGKTERVEWSEEQQKWVPLATPIYTPGELSLLERERDRICDDGFWDVCEPSEEGTIVRYHSVDSTGELPDGWVPAPGETVAPNRPVRTLWRISDEEAYDAWLKAQYAGTESHGQALARVNRRIDELLKKDLPAAQAAVFDGEVYCRKRLIDQGYYAEAHFNTTDGMVDETVTTRPIFNYVTNEDAEAPELNVRRYWRFRVQSVPEGPTGIYNDDGLLAPIDVTPLEQVYYKLQLDPLPTFDSQPGKMPLREVLFNENGQRLSVARFEGGQAFGTTPTPPGAEEPESGSDTVTLGGSVRLLPEQLPGQQEGDVLPAGREDWSGDYHARIAAYNVIKGPLLARPRPLITSITPTEGSDLLTVSYLAQGHHRIQRASMTNERDPWYRLLVSGYEVSKHTKTPRWEEVVPINFVSDRRSPLETGTPVNRFSWVPRGTDRPHPTIYYDDDLQQYVMAHAKQGFSSRWRITTGRAMALPIACEYESLFEARAEGAMYGPHLLKVGGQLSLYFTAQTGAGNPQLMRSVSTDADRWSDPIPVAGITGASFPSVVFHDGTYHLWYQRDDAIYYATSSDGIAFYPAFDGPVCVSPDGLERPSVVRINDAWVMYVHDKTTHCIASYYSTDGVGWEGYRIELEPELIQWDGELVEAVPRFPAAYMDRYLGNRELFMVFNYVHPDTGEARVHYARLEDRVWHPGAPGGLIAAAGHAVNVPFSREGVAREFKIDMSENGIAPGDMVKLRLRFDEIEPGVVEYHRQSEWIDGNTAGLYGAYLHPTPWEFDLGLLQVPYMRMTRSTT